jgi:hypothetical protein
MSEVVKESQQIEELLMARKKRLRVLEVRQAELGIGTPPEIIVEIEDYRAKIEDIEKQLKTLNDSLQLDTQTGRHERFGESERRKVEVKIELRGDYDALTIKKRDAIIMAIAAIAEISLGQVEIIDISSGSIIIRLTMPEYAAINLATQFLRKDSLIDELGIDNIVIWPRIGLLIRSLRDKRDLSESDFAARIRNAISHGKYLQREHFLKVDKIDEDWVKSVEEGSGMIFAIDSDFSMLELVSQALEVTREERQELYEAIGLDIQSSDISLDHIAKRIARRGIRSVDRTIEKLSEDNKSDSIKKKIRDQKASGTKRKRGRSSDS